VGLDGGGGGQDEDLIFGGDWWRFERNAGVPPFDFAQGRLLRALRFARNDVIIFFGLIFFGLG
jgi:hypothetical protein